MHQALYRKWRPKNFSEVCGQEHITSILKQEASEGRFNHAYLFCGSRGTGKTTCAKILSKVVNCENVIDGNPCGACPSCLAIESGSTTDVLEMDAASNNGVDNIRDIRDEVIYSPSFLKYRVYIVDEVHMLSNSAFNALLKTLEEPPSHAIFILATTELHKLPATIVSRCQRFEFRRIATDVLTSRVKYIAEQEGIEITDDAARLIARYSQGGMRDSISLLELCASGGAKVDRDLVNETVGSAGRERMMEIAGAIASKNFDLLFGEIDAVVTSSKDITVFWQDLISLYRDILIVKTVKESARYLDLTDFEYNQLTSLAERFSRETLIYHCRMLEEALASMQASGAVKRIIAELCFVKMCDDSLNTSNEALLSRIVRLEAKIASGNAVLSSETPSDKKAEVKKAPAPVSDEKGTDLKQEKKVVFEPEEKRVAPKKVSAPGALAVKQLKCWSEVVQALQSLDVSAYAFLKKTRAYFSDADGKLHVLTDSVSLFAIDRAPIKRAIAASLTGLLERPFTEADIVYDIDNGKVIVEDDLSDLDDF